MREAATRARSRAGRSRHFAQVEAPRAGLRARACGCGRTCRGTVAGRGGDVSHERYEKVLHERGFEIVAGDDRLPLPTNPLVLGLRTKLLSARKRVGRATLDIELQDARSMNSAALAGTARITGPAIAGEGQLRPRPVWGIWRLLTSGPKILTYVLLFFLVIGVWVVMLPGILLVWLASRGALRRQGLEPRPALTDAAARGHYNVWSRDPEAARAALPAARQAAIGATSWCAHSPLARTPRP